VPTNHVYHRALIDVPLHVGHEYNLRMIVTETLGNCIANSPRPSFFNTGTGAEKTKRVLLPTTSLDAHLILLALE
jgi:hypothetical protein